ncbi:factor for adipocyte [Fusarium phyllophilum]|uniref:Factor for adipocyte n=1 Tax=Fusarium phyllophilum TaxID=47803 RepID=A0A8H5IVM4_9HYPO|nr:factor for adipocyte [Fusarium phyllophilum]
MKTQAAQWLLLLALRLATVSSSPVKSTCPDGSCLCNGDCRVLLQDESCCPPGDGWLQHICGPDRACCREGCCPEGWTCGANGMCGPPLPSISDPTTVITLRKPEFSSPTADDNISGKIPTNPQPLPVTTTPERWLSEHTTVSSISSHIFITAGPPVLTLPSNRVTTSSHEVVSGTGHVTTIPNDQPTTGKPEESSVVSRDVPDGDTTISNTHIVSVSSESAPVTTLPGGLVTTSPFSPGTDLSETVHQPITVSPGEDDRSITTIVTPSTNDGGSAASTSDQTLPTNEPPTSILVPSGTSSTAITRADTLTTSPFATGTLDSLLPSQDTTDSEHHSQNPSSVTSVPPTSVDPVPVTEQSSHAEATQSEYPLPTSPVTKERLITAPQSTVNPVTTLPDGQVTTLPRHSNSDATKAPESTKTTGVVPVIVPITTPVPDPERSDNGIKIPCDMWFFDLCLAPIGGWSFVLPPGTHPPGPPPIIKIDPTAPIKVDITGSIPWPGFTIDPAGNPTFSSKPDDSQSTIATCGTIYGCDVEGEDSSRTISKTTTVSTETPTISAIRLTWEEWDIGEYTEAQLNDIADAAQARLDKKFGIFTSPTSQVTTTGATTESFPTLTRAPAIGVPTSSGFSCVSTATYTSCGGSGNREACVEKPTCASWVNTAAVTMTTPEITPFCDAGYETYSATAHAAIPTQGGPLKFFIPVSDDKGSDWDFVIDDDDIKEAVKSWKVGNDDDDSIESGDGGKGLEIKWKVPNDSSGTYVELLFKTSDVGEKRFTFMAKGGIVACMPNCKDDATTTTDADGMVCTHYPCHSPNCEQGPAPEPQAACELVEDGLAIPLFYTVTIVANGYSWIDDDGKKLKNEEEGCGAMTDWHSSAIEVETGDGWTARHRFTFTLPITIKAGCVERAIASAGGPSDLQCDNKEGDLW